MRELKSPNHATNVRKHHWRTKAAGAAVLLQVLTVAPALRGATVIYKAANAAVYLGLPLTQLEFENPLSTPAPGAEF